MTKGIEQGAAEDRRHGWLWEFRSQNRKEVGQHPQNRNPQGQEGVVQAAVEEDSKGDDEDEETVLPLYYQKLKDNVFIHISVHGGANKEESAS